MSQHAFITRARCVTCRRCIAVCPSGAIAIDGDACVVDEALCLGCGACVPACRTNAITMVEPTQD
ncbi:MAG: 4Fe-4S binding protein [Spirochaetales bacterium]|nr:4Fe-4S binding protein [Spirochaetales bacterium]